MDGIIGTVVNIVGVDMPNQNNRRDFIADEYELYDKKKARPYWQEICKANRWVIVKDDEDYAEDFVCKISNTLYFMELQVIGYWHNFDVSKLNTAYISKSKIDSLKEKGEKAGLIFLNCVPNRFFGLNIDLIQSDWLITNIAEKSYRIPLKEIKFNQRVLLDQNLCDCLENHYNIMQRQKGRIAMAEKDFNYRGKNGICC
jgi:hypothetical protein